MKLGAVSYVLGWFFVFFAGSLIFPGALAIYFQEYGSLEAFILSSAISVLSGGLLIKYFGEKEELGHRDGFAIVVFGWLGASIFGALPYVFSETMGFVDAFFESVSGFTTTGSTILAEIEPLPKSLLFWRSLTQWLGGMGIIILSLAILPVLGVGGMQLYQAEMPGPTKDRLAPRIQDTARILWGVYLFFTVLETLLLIGGGLSPYEAVCHSFTTMATGGFSTRTASIGAFDSPYVDYVITFFMFVAGINFTLHYRFLTGRLTSFWRSEEFRFYLWIGLGASLICTFFPLWAGIYEDFFSALRFGTFQVWSIMTTTGFGTADFDLWPPVCKLLLLSLMFLGGCAGSTGGGIKQIRLLVFLKFMRVQLQRLIHPRAVGTIKIDNHRVDQEVLQGVLGFLALYMTVFVIASLIVTAQGLDLITGTSAVIATLNNIGPGLGAVGPTKHFAHLPDLSKVVLSFCMLAGRLELYTIAVLLSPAYWQGIRFSKRLKDRTRNRPL
ncbi:TrkH family potassium uptake protein [Thermosulfuriphilus sp.]